MIKLMNANLPLWFVFNSYSAGIDFRSQNLTAIDVVYRHITHNIQIKRKELTKIFMMIPNGKKRLGPHGLFKSNSALKGLI